MTENQHISELIKKGYKVNIINPNAAKFNEKYSVYTEDEVLGKRWAILNENGQIIGQQG